MTINLRECRRIDYGEVPSHLIPSAPRQTIELSSGIALTIAELHQTYTYAGMLCGAPRGHHMPIDIQRTIAKANKYYSDLPGDRVFVIPPVISAGIQLSAIPHLHKTTRDPWEKLPDVTTIALLEKHNNAMECLAAVWWQDTLGYPPPAIIDELKAMDWAALCLTVDL